MNKALLAATVIGTGALALASDLSAQENPTGFYVGGGFGRFNLDIDNLDEAGDAVERIVESDDNAWKIFGGYRVNPYLAVEAAYVDLGRPSDRFETSGSDGNYRVDIAGFSPSVLGIIPVGPVELFGKLGYYFYDVDVRVDLDDPGPAVSSSHSDSNFTYGGGVGITLAERLNLRVEYEVLDLDRAPNSDALWLSGAFRF